MAESLQPVVGTQWTPSAVDVSAIQRLQWLTVISMLIEVVVALFSAVRARSVALAAFGGDSAIELLSAVAVLWRFGTSRENAEETGNQNNWLAADRARCVHRDRLALHTVCCSCKATLKLHRNRSARCSGTCYAVAWAAQAAVSSDC
jgi:hypothetical protein